MASAPLPTMVFIRRICGIHQRYRFRQRLDNLVVGSTYSLSFEYNARSGNQPDLRFFWMGSLFSRPLSVRSVEATLTEKEH